MIELEKSVNPCNEKYMNYELMTSELCSFRLTHLLRKLIEILKIKQEENCTK